MKSFGRIVVFVALVVCSTSQLGYAVPAPARAELRAKYNVVEGKKIYEESCAACHTTGLLTAPKLCDVQAWNPRIANGMEVLLQHTVQDYKSMPARGGLESLTIAECGNAVAYMVDQCLTR